LGTLPWAILYSCFLTDLIGIRACSAGLLVVIHPDASGSGEKAIAISLQAKKLTGSCRAQRVTFYKSLLNYW
jgi:hypothetical protein